MNPIRIDKFLINPMVTFWLIIFCIISSLIYTIIIFSNKEKTKRDFQILNVFILTTLAITGFHYWSMGQQGLQTILVNPYTATKAAQLVPNIKQITNVDTINSLSNEQKEKTIIIVFKFGCPDCQQLWLYAQNNSELLPSENILWVSNKDSNKKESELVASSTKYPSIIYWTKQNKKLVENRIEEPTDEQLKILSQLAKEYSK